MRQPTLWRRGTIPGPLAAIACALVALPATLTAQSPGGGADAGGDADLLASAEQRVVVVVDEADHTTGLLHRYERGPDTSSSGGGWRAVGEPVPVVVGRSGVGPKQEGDGRSPQGVFPLGGAFGYGEAAPSGVSLPYRPLTARTRCVDDVESRHYNRIVEEDDVAVDWDSAEQMRRDLAYGDDLYALGVEVEYNTRPVPGDGSCIFLHIWRGPESPTAGCTAMSRDDLLALLRWLDPERSPILVQGSRAYVEGFEG